MAFSQLVLLLHQVVETLKETLKFSNRNLANHNRAKVSEVSNKHQELLSSIRLFRTMMSTKNLSLLNLEWMSLSSNTWNTSMHNTLLNTDNPNQLVVVINLHKLQLKLLQLPQTRMLSQNNQQTVDQLLRDGFQDQPLKKHPRGVSQDGSLQDSWWFEHAHILYNKS